MANTYKRIYIHLIFAVKYRHALLDIKWREDVFRYIAGIINRRGNHALAVNGYTDHIHIFLDYKENELISELVREVKKASTAFINNRNYLEEKFQWQGGYGVFSHGQNDKNTIIEYVKNQCIQHSNNSFEMEYKQLLDTHEIEFTDQYNFTFHNEN